MSIASDHASPQPRPKSHTDKASFMQAPSSPGLTNDIDRDSCMAWNRWRCKTIQSSLTPARGHLSTFITTCLKPLDKYQKALGASTKKSLRSQAGRKDDAHTAFCLVLNTAATGKQFKKSKSKILKNSSQDRHERVVESWGVEKGASPKCICHQSSEDVWSWDDFVASVVASKAIESATLATATPRERDDQPEDKGDVLDLGSEEDWEALADRAVMRKMQRKAMAWSKQYSYEYCSRPA